MNNVDRTIFVVDCKETLNTLVKDLPVTFNKSKRHNETVLSNLSVQRSVASFCIQSILEYSRVGYDLYPDETQVCEESFLPICPSNQ